MPTTVSSGLDGRPSVRDVLYVLELDLAKVQEDVFGILADPDASLPENTRQPS